MTLIRCTISFDTWITHGIIPLELTKLPFVCFEKTKDSNYSTQWKTVEMKAMSFLSHIRLTRNYSSCMERMPLRKSYKKRLRNLVPYWIYGWFETVWVANWKVFLVANWFVLNRLLKHCSHSLDQHLFCNSIERMIWACSIFKPWL